MGMQRITSSPGPGVWALRDRQRIETETGEGGEGSKTRRRGARIDSKVKVGGFTIDSQYVCIGIRLRNNRVNTSLLRY